MVINGLTHTRTVLLILTEYLPGPSMAQMIVAKHVRDSPAEEDLTRPSKKFPVQRTTASTPSLARQSRTWMARVWQGDFAPRDIGLLGGLQSPHAPSRDW